MNYYQTIAKMYELTDSALHYNVSPEEKARLEEIEEHLIKLLNLNDVKETK